MTTWTDFNAGAAAPATTSTHLEFCTGHGQFDTRKDSGHDYGGITGKEVVAMLRDPPSVDKAQARWFIPSTYRASDGRVFEAQREHGAFWFLCLDEDGDGENNLSLHEIDQTLARVCGPVARMIYSTRSSTAVRRKWRALIPLHAPISGADYGDTVGAFNAALIEASAGVLIPDPALERAAQLIYLPNRGEHYEHRAVKGNRLVLTADHEIIRRRDAIRAERKQDEDAARARRERKRAEALANPGGNASIIEAFNGNTTVADELARYGYTMSRNGRDWRSPNSSTGSYAVHDYGEFWISLSGSDAMLEIGNTSPTGQRIGDAFDLFVHYEHGGEFKAAIKAYAKEIGEDHASRHGQGQEAPSGEATPETEPLFKPASSYEGKLVPDRQWLIKGLIPMGTVTLLGGDGGTGKSLLALQLAASTATGLAWLGQPLDTTGRALVLSAEDDDAELHRRVGDIGRSNGLQWGDLSEMHVRSLAGEDALLAKLNKDGSLDKTPMLERLDKALVELQPAVVVLDTLADLFPGNENDRAQARQFIGILRGLAIKHNCAVVLLAHPSLSGMASGKGTSGSTAWNNSVRSRLYMERVTVQEGNITIEDDPDRRVLRGMKSNYARTGSEISMTWREGVFVADQAPAAGLDKKAAEGKAERVFMRLLDEFAKEGRFVKSAIGAGYAAKVFASSGRAEGISKQALHAAMERLFAKGEIVEELGGDGPPSKHKMRLVRTFQTPS